MPPACFADTHREPRPELDVDLNQELSESRWIPPANSESLTSSTSRHNCSSFSRVEHRRLCKDRVESVSSPEGLRSRVRGWVGPDVLGLVHRRQDSDHLKYRSDYTVSLKATGLARQAGGLMAQTDSEKVPRPAPSLAGRHKR